jgi:hypothetical protein
MNALTIYSVGMLGSLFSMVNFRRKSKFMNSEADDHILNYNKMKSVGFNSMSLAFIQISIW